MSATLVPAPRTNGTHKPKPTPKSSGTCRWITRPTFHDGGGRFTAELAINDEPYKLSGYMDQDEGQDVCVVRIRPLESLHGDYTVVMAVADDQTLSLVSCDCGDSTFRDKGGRCKHGLATRAALANHLEYQRAEHERLTVEANIARLGEPCAFES